MLRVSLLLTLTLLLAACQTGGSSTGGSSTGTGAANPVAGAAIETTTLDAPVVGLAEEQATENPEPPFAAEPDSETATGPVTPEPLSDLDARPTDAAPAEDPAPEVPEAIDPALLTPEALACQRRGGQWARIGEGNARSCLRRTRDAGKRCDADRDCQGVCLARSGTCAPVDPLFGCNEVLQDDGRRMTLCLN